MKQVVLAGACVVGVALQAATDLWHDAAAGQIGRYGKGLGGANTLVVPAGDHDSVASAQRYFADQSGAALTVLGTGASMNLPARSDGFEYEEYPWSLYGISGALVSLRRWSHKASSHAASGPQDAVLASTNGSFRILNDGAGTTEAHFDGGFWNFVTPDGVTQNGNTLSVNNLNDASATNKTYFHGGTYLIGSLHDEAYGASNLFQLDGGAQMTVSEQSSWLVHADNRPVTDQWVLSGEGTQLTFNQRFWFSSLNNYANYDNRDRTLAITVKDGATLSFPGGIPDQNGKFKCKFFVDGGTLNLSGTAYIGFYDNSPTDFVINNGTLKGIYHLGRRSPCSIFATNSTINSGPYLGPYASLGFENCVLKKGFALPGCTDGTVQEVFIRNGGPNTGALCAATEKNGRARIVVDNCTVTGGNAPKAGTGDHSVGELVFMNGATYEHDGSGHIGTGTGAWGKMSITENAWYHQYYWDLNVGTGVGATGIVYVASGGEFIHPSVGSSDGYKLLVGTAGRGEIIVDDGGVFKARRIILGGTETGEGHIYLYEGGLINVINVITNGVGYGELHANGGTLFGRDNCDTFLQDLAKAEIGDHGLTIESEKTLTINQAFCNMAGNTGVLTLAGSGTKTLTGASTHAKTVIAAGTATIGSMSGAIEVTGGAKLDYANGVADAVTIGGLYLGDDETFGYLAVDPTDVITVTGSMDFKNAYIILSDAFAEDGDYSLFRTSGTVPVSVQEAWANAVVASGRVEGKAYVFSTYTDDEGVTHFRVKVAVKTDVTGTRAWRGEGETGAWATAANWEGSALPGDKEAALFDSAAAAKRVTVDGLVMPGALTFAADGYTVSGAGKIRLSPLANGYVTVQAGTNTVETGVTLDGLTPFTAAADTKLTLSGNITGGGFQKTGAGEIVLAGTNGFVNGFNTTTGRTVVCGVEAFGITEKSSDKTVTQQGGTLKVERTEAGDALAYEFKADAGNNRPYIIDTATPLVISNFTRTSGCFIKRGAGRLTIETDKDIVLSTSAESGTFWWGRKMPIFSFPADGSFDTSVHYGGFNVAEGEVLVKGTATSRKTVTFKAVNFVGMNTPDGVAEPRLVFDHVYVDNSNDNRPLTLCKMASEGAFMTTPVLRFQNDAKSYHNRICIGAGEQGTGFCEKDVYPRLEIDNSYVQVGYNFYIDAGAKSYTTVDVRNGATFIPASGMNLKSSTALVVDNSTICGNSGGLTSLSVAWVYPGYVEPEISAVFQNGAVAQMSAVSRQWKPNYRNTYGHKAINVAFDRATWETLGKDVRLLAGGGETIVQDVRAGGLEINASAKTMRVETPFVGVGTITKTGAGTVWFDAAKTIADSPGGEKPGPTNLLERIVTMDAAGLTVNGGTAIVSNGTIRADAVVRVGEGAVLDLSGSTVEVDAIGGRGTVRNGTLKVKRILADGADLHFSGATLACDGMLRVDFERDAAHPIDYKAITPLTLATFTGVEQGAFRVKVINSGVAGLGGTTVVEDGVLKINLVTHGMYMLVR